MTRGETTRIMAVLQAAYPAYYRGMSANELEPVISLWAEMLADYPADVCALAVKRLFALDAKGYPPTIGQVIASVQAVLDPPEQRMTETEAWGLVKRAAANGYYHAAEEYAKLPPEIRRIIGDADTLHEWSQTESLDTVIAASFMRSYRALTEHKEAAMALPPGMRRQIGAVGDRMRIAEPAHRAIEAPQPSGRTHSPQGSSPAMEAFFARLRELTAEKFQMDNIRDNDAEARADRGTSDAVKGGKGMNALIFAGRPRTKKNSPMVGAPWRDTQ